MSVRPSNSKKTRDITDFVPIRRPNNLIQSKRTLLPRKSYHTKGKTRDLGTGATPIPASFDWRTKTDTRYVKYPETKSYT